VWDKFTSFPLTREFRLTLSQWARRKAFEGGEGIELNSPRVFQDDIAKLKAAGVPKTTESLSRREVLPDDEIACEDAPV
jgi:hypothetical protein